MGAVGDVGSDAGVAVGQDIGGAQPAVVLVDAQEAGLNLEQAHDVDDGVDGDDGGTLREGDVEVGDLPLGHPDHPHRPQADVAEGRTRVVALVALEPERHRDDGEDRVAPSSAAARTGTISITPPST